MAGAYALDEIQTAVDIEDRHDAYVVTVRVLGISGTDLSVSIERGLLVVSGETIRNEESMRTRIHRIVQLPFDADSEVVSTTFKEEAVIVELPKMAPDAILPGGGAIGDELLAKAVAEAELLAAQSPRFARWLRAHGYLTNSSVVEPPKMALDAVFPGGDEHGDELLADAVAKTEDLAAESHRFSRWLRART